MVIGEVRALGVEVVDVWGLNDGVSVAAEVAVSLIIGDDKNDVWVCG